ncbi:MAG: hypothetical protein HYY46_05545 [Deltaproteobacteria bacterium]|nr:hypothetical protein [Deltaproteobacteria bacterium]
MKKRNYQGVLIKKRLFVEGFRLLRRMAQSPLSQADAESELKIPYREWYRWLKVLREAGIPLAEDYRREHGRKLNEKTYRLWPEDWDRLIGKKTQRHGAGQGYEYDPELEKAATEIEQNVSRLKQLIGRAGNGPKAKV